jgi:probable rRNA maturation factor
MGRQHQNIVVQVTKNFENIELSLPKLKKLVRTICNRFGILRVTVGVVIVDNEQIRKINKEFLNRRRTSDCLSFDLSDSRPPPLLLRKKLRGSPRLFELVVNGEMAVKEASLRGHSGEAELALYVTHGLLHNIGFDDSTKKKATKMHDTEDEILQQLGYGLVYKRSVKSRIYNCRLSSTDRKSEIENRKSR